ncbi:hypothetical protein [Edaphosphingomonas haloaromaticamans]|uniref:Uncharacterized protein n=1 Tax=Edaphosphingomonas haloaromaticamans TaxID=653954 RepID=A0A1S1HB53_9SPHN|nr:hypothetical protein [Sphingomonas haloaromaticamans]OHT19394.1 hypothetical protein BHE75_01379 [Sphingomonas haloaromaticamans]
MLLRWLRRRGWRRTAAFEEDVTLAIAEMRQLHGEAALDHARRKARRRDQRTRRKWVWREAVRRLAADGLADANLKAGASPSEPGYRSPLQHQ